MYRRIEALLIVAVLVALPVGAQVSTDRPDFTDSPLTIAPRSIQVETGLTLTFIGDETGQTFGEPLVRYGLPSALELRVGLPSYFSGDISSNGLSDPSIGVKWSITDFAENGSIGVIGTLSLPLGADDLTSDGVDPSIALTAGKPLNDRFSLGAQILGTWMTAGNDRMLNWAGTIVLSTPIGENMGAFAEIKADAPEIGEESYLAHFGLLKALNENLQVDIHGGFGLSEFAPDSFLGFGLSFRR